MRGSLLIDADYAISEPHDEVTATRVQLGADKVQLVQSILAQELDFIFNDIKIPVLQLCAFD